MLMEDEPALRQRPRTRRVADQEEKDANRQVQKQMLATVGQLNKRLEKLEEQLSAMGSAAGSLPPMVSSQSGPEEDWMRLGAPAR